MEESTVNQWCTRKLIVIVGFLDLYKFYINIQKHTSNLGYKYWIPRSLYMTKNHLSPVCGILESSEDSKGLPEHFLIRAFPY